jgi:hypothetical protein
MRAIKAIPTKFKGYNFRSRLEARWGVFFENIGVEWEYEPEGFELPSGTRYLPDFRVRSKMDNCHVICWYDVKPRKGQEGDDAKINEFSESLHPEGTVELGAPAYGGVLRGDPLDVLGAGLDSPKHLLNGTAAVCPRCGYIASPSYGAYLNGGPTSGGNLFIFGCEPCDFDTPCGGGNPAECGLLTGVKVFPHKGMLDLSASDWLRHLAHVRVAAEAARSARFEYGATGFERY